MSDLSTRKAATAPGQPPFSCNSRFAAVEILRTSPTLDANTKRSLTAYLVSGKSEHKPPSARKAPQASSSMLSSGTGYCVLAIQRITTWQLISRRCTSR